MVFLKQTHQLFKDRYWQVLLSPLLNTVSKIISRFTFILFSYFDDT